MKTAPKVTNQNKCRWISFMTLRPFTLYTNPSFPHVCHIIESTVSTRSPQTAELETFSQPTSVYAPVTCQNTAPISLVHTSCTSSVKHSG